MQHLNICQIISVRYRAFESALGVKQEFASHDWVVPARCCSFQFVNWILPPVIPGIMETNSAPNPPKNALVEMIIYQFK